MIDSAQEEYLMHLRMIFFYQKLLNLWLKPSKDVFYFVTAVVKYNRKLLKGDHSQEKQMHGKTSQDNPKLKPMSEMF